MKLSLSTNWCNRRLESGEAIADKAIELGFDELELGFHTSEAQIPGFRTRLDQIPVGSIHAFCPVPLSAPQGYPELYSLASFDADARGLARFHIANNIRFAADIGARTVVLHVGRVMFSSFWRPNLNSGLLRTVLTKAKGVIADKAYQNVLSRALKVRTERGTQMVETVKGELEQLIPVLEENRIVLALENLPYLEGFPNEAEMAALAEAFKGAPVQAWFDTGHHRVRACHGWVSQGCSGSQILNSSESQSANQASSLKSAVTDSVILPYPIRGLHLNDVVDFNDDHLPPGEGRVDFVALKDLAAQSAHVVIEPNSGVTEEALRRGVQYIRSIWC